MSFKRDNAVARVASSSKRTNTNGGTDSYLRNQRSSAPTIFKRPSRFADHPCLVGVEHGERTVLVSTHLISEFEGLIDRFTILDAGKAVMTADADEARSRFLRVQAEFAQDPPPDSALPGARTLRRRGRTLEVLLEGDPGPIRQRLEDLGGRDLTVSSLTLEEIFMEVAKSGGRP